MGTAGGSVIRLQIKTMSSSVPSSFSARATANWRIASTSRLLSFLAPAASMGDRLRAFMRACLAIGDISRLFDDLDPDDDAPGFPCVDFPAGDPDGDAAFAASEEPGFGMPGVAGFLVDFFAMLHASQPDSVAS